MVSIESMLAKFSFLSVNQLNAQIKLLEIWKAMNIEDYPLKIKKQVPLDNRVNTRADIRERPPEIGLCNVTKSTCISDAIRIWNKAQDKVTKSVSVYQVKKEIRAFVVSLPV